MFIKLTYKQIGKLYKQTKQLHLNTNPCQSKSILSIFRQIWGLTLHFLSHGSGEHSTGASMVAVTATSTWGWGWFGLLESDFCWVFIFSWFWVGSGGGSKADAVAATR